MSKINVKRLGAYAGCLTCGLIAERGYEAYLRHKEEKLRVKTQRLEDELSWDAWTVKQMRRTNENLVKTLFGDD